MLGVLFSLGLLASPIQNVHYSSIPHTHIPVTVKWCKEKDPTYCRHEEIAPANHATVSIMECMRGIAMLSARFEYEGEWWVFKGGECHEEESVYQAWKTDRGR